MVNRMFLCWERCASSFPYIALFFFIITAEILGIAIRRSDDVKGFQYKNAESKLSQYADDTQIIIDGSENSIKTSINILNEFSKISGLKVNLNKSELIPLGHSKVEIYTHNFSPGIEIITDKFKLLCIIIPTNGKQKNPIEENNYNKRKKNRNYKNLAKERFNFVWQTNNHQKFGHTTINLCTEYFTFARRTLFKSYWKDNIKFFLGWWTSKD